MTDVTDLPAPRRFPEHRRVAHRRLLEDAVRRAPHCRRWTAPVTLASGAVIVLTTGAAAAYVALAPATDHSRVRCYSEASLGGGGSYKGTDAGTPESSTAGKITAVAPLDLCSALWRAGVVLPGHTHAETPVSQPQPIPPLVACTLKDGVAAVFPGDVQTCAKLGLPAWSG